MKFLFLLLLWASGVHSFCVRYEVLFNEYTSGVAVGTQDGLSFALLTSSRVYYRHLEEPFKPARLVATPEMFYFDLPSDLDDLSGVYYDAMSFYRDTAYDVDSSSQFYEFELELVYESPLLGISPNAIYLLACGSSECTFFQLVGQLTKIGSVIPFQSSPKWITAYSDASTSLFSVFAEGGYNIFEIDSDSVPVLLTTIFMNSAVTIKGGLQFIDANNGIICSTYCSEISFRSSWISNDQSGASGYIMAHSASSTEVDIGLTDCIYMSASSTGGTLAFLSKRQCRVGQLYFSAPTGSNFQRVEVSDARLLISDNNSNTYYCDITATGYAVIDVEHDCTVTRNVVSASLVSEGFVSCSLVSAECRIYKEVSCAQDRCAPFRSGERCSVYLEFSDFLLNDYSCKEGLIQLSPEIEIDDPILAISDQFVLISDKNNVVYVNGVVYHVCDGSCISASIAYDSTYLSVVDGGSRRYYVYNANTGDVVVMPGLTNARFVSFAKTWNLFSACNSNRCLLFSYTETGFDQIRSVSIGGTLATPFLFSTDHYLLYCVQYKCFYYVSGVRHIAFFGNRVSKAVMSTDGVHVLICTIPEITSQEMCKHYENGEMQAGTVFLSPDNSFTSVDVSSDGRYILLCHHLFSDCKYCSLSDPDKCFNVPHSSVAILGEDNTVLGCSSLDGCRKYLLNDCLCPSGQYREAETGKCDDCMPGSHSPFTNQDQECQLCASGRYSDTTGQSECVSCPGDQFTAEQGSSSCSDCLNGATSIWDDGRDCQCDTGFFNNDNDGECVEFFDFTIQGVEQECFQNVLSFSSPFITVSGDEQWYIRRGTKDFEIYPSVDNDVNPVFESAFRWTSLTGSITQSVLSIFGNYWIIIRNDHLEFYSRYNRDYYIRNYREPISSSEASLSISDSGVFSMCQETKCSIYTIVYTGSRPSQNIETYFSPSIGFPSLPHIVTLPSSQNIRFGQLFDGYLFACDDSRECYWIDYTTNNIVTSMPLPPHPQVYPLYLKLLLADRILLCDLYDCWLYAIAFSNSAQLIRKFTFGKPGLAELNTVDTNMDGSLILFCFVQKECYLTESESESDQSYILSGLVGDIGKISSKGDIIIVCDSSKANSNCYIHNINNCRCTKGEYLDVSSDSCQNCPIGRYKAINGTSECSYCPGGTFSDAQGRSACESCPAGKMSSTITTKRVKCYNCIYGKYQASASSSVCDACEPGRYQDMPGQTDCAVCQAGRFSAGGGESTCSVCVAGKYTAPGATTCQHCPPGKYNDITGASNCIECDPGRYSTATGQTACTLCEAGKYSESSGTSSDACISCNPGTYQDTSGSSSCLLCDAGRYASQYQSVVCNSCEPGTFSRAMGKTFCKQCKAGSFSLEEGSTYCKRCPNDMYTDTEGSIVCESCPNLSKTSSYFDGGSSCSCKTGHTGDNCESYLDSLSMGPCDLQPDGEFFLFCPGCILSFSGDERFYLQVTPDRHRMCDVSDTMSSECTTLFNEFSSTDTLSAVSADGSFYVVSGPSHRALYRHTRSSKSIDMLHQIDTPGYIPKVSDDDEFSICFAGVCDIYVVIDDTLQVRDWFGLVWFGFWLRKHCVSLYSHFLYSFYPIFRFSLLSQTRNKTPPLAALVHFLSGTNILLPVH